MPAYFPPASIVTDLLIVTAPKFPDSLTTISPPALVFARAPVRVLQGLALVQALLSSPDSATQVLFAAALRELANRTIATSVMAMESVLEVLRVFISFEPPSESA
jgi:hypothetical protein